ncbi:MAG TPA: DUF167 domain-containing protein [Candidatus Acidoferrales bacterium]|nr:DUF167 domain-containing protein [Candidatus Acidoferrales bacterium]
MSSVVPATRLRVKVQARARRNEVSGLQGDILRVKVTAPPVEGKANHAVVELLAAHLRVPKSSIRIVSGERAPLKLIEVAGLDSATVAERLRLNTPE